MNTDPISFTRECAPERRTSLSPVRAVAAIFALLAALPVAYAETPQPPAVTVATVAMKPLVASIPISGSVVARDMVEVNPDVGNAEIVELLVDVGDEVAAGDLLVRLDDSRLRSALLRAQTDVARARASMEQSRSRINAAQSVRDSADAARNRNKELFDRGSVAQASLDAAVSALASAEADLVAARDGLLIAQADLDAADAGRALEQHDLESAEVRAHAGGLIVERNIDQGAIAGGAAGPLFRIVRDGVHEVEATVFENALVFLKVGDAVELSLPGGISAQGLVRLVPPAVDPATRLGRVRIALDAQLDEQLALRLGMSASGIVKSDPHDGLTVPATAVL
ncbi:MAG TPA: efflux RND transporter periplasmic adaptor subunit, partial [Saliniramus sp.]|nr:efflux RND transporter periplasmic adaptor subunit [Saliniramus sp.]